MAETGGQTGEHSQVTDRREIFLKDDSTVLNSNYWNENSSWAGPP